MASDDAIGTSRTARAASLFSASYTTYPASLPTDRIDFQTARRGRETPKQHEYRFLCTPDPSGRVVPHLEFLVVSNRKQRTGNSAIVDESRVDSHFEGCQLQRRTLRNSVQLPHCGVCKKGMN